MNWRKNRICGVIISARFYVEDKMWYAHLVRGKAIFQGNIISIIYKGDHYNYRVLSENKVEYSVDDEDLWNIGDFVSVVVPEDAMVFESVSEDAEWKMID